MSRKLSFEIGGVRDDERVNVTVGGRCLTAGELSRGYYDPGEPLRSGTDDPGEPLRSGTDDPGEPLRSGTDDPGEPLRSGTDDPGEPLRSGTDDPAGSPLYCGGFDSGFLASASNGHNGSVDSAPLVQGLPVPSERYSGFIIVRLSPLVPKAEQGTNDLLKLAKQLGLDGLRRALRRFGKPASAPAVKPRDPQSEDGEACSCQCPKPISLEDLERRAAATDLAPRHSLRSYWRLDARCLNLRGRWWREARRRDGLAYSVAELSRKLVDELNSLSEVGLAYRELAATDPSGAQPAANEFTDFQLYLDEQPFGIDARWARARLNGARDQINLADLEQGWIVDHEELVGVLNPGLFGENRHGVEDYSGSHGTAVVSELVGDADNDLGVEGVAANVAKVTLASHYRSTGGGDSETTWPSNGHVADAIAALMTGTQPALGAGDILLLEVQKAGEPTEVEPLDFDAIRLASANGVIVVEAAGNGGLDLDRLVTEDGRSLNKSSRYFRDSGAIMVGASRAAVPHDRAGFSNFGSRIDCFGWGEGVVAAGYGNYLSGADTAAYTDRFSGTSSASPMIAGAALLVQSLYRQNAAPAPAGVDDKSWERLSPGQMRTLLANPQTGTSQGPNVPGRIGVMPNLRAVVDRALGIVPQVYLRDHVGDNGETPNGGRNYCSPDIIVTNVEADKLEKEFGQGTRSENALISEPSNGGADTKVFVRVCNRGLKEAEEVQATIYCAPRSTLLTPDRWRKVAPPVKLPAVPQGNTLVLSKPVGLGPTTTGSDAFVAVVEYKGGREGPVPCPPSNLNWSKFLDEMRQNRNVAVRNVHTVDISDGLVIPPLEFVINGTPDAPRVFQFELIQQLSEGVGVDLIAPLGVALKFSRGRLWKPERNLPPDKDKDTTTLHLPKQPRLMLGSARLPAAVPFPCSFTLSHVADIKSGHSLAIRQLYGGEEVGRITWLFRRQAN